VKAAKGTRRVTVSIRAADQELLDQLVADGHARSVSAAFRLLCDSYRAMEADRTFDEVIRGADRTAVLDEVGLLDPPRRAGGWEPRWSALGDPGDPSGT
jgi:hypothetical protein